MALQRGKTGPLLRLLELCWQIQFYPFHFRKSKEKVDQQYVIFPMWSSGSTNPQNNNEDAAFDDNEHDFDAKKPESEVILSPSSKFEDCSDNNSNKVNAAGSIVPAIGQNSLNNTNTFSDAGPSNAAVSPTYGKSSFIDASQLLDDLDMPELEDITYSDDEDVVGVEADFNNLESSILVSPIPTTRIHKDHHVSQIIGDLSSTTQIRSMTRVVKDQVAYLTKSDASKGFTQVIDFLNRSYIKYALTMNPDIYVSYIKQFWNTVAIKQVNDVTRLQALVDMKKVVITDAAIREVLRLDDAEGVDCLPNEEIFAELARMELARMGYEKPSTKLTFYKAFFSSQWKFLIHSTVTNLVRNVDNTSKFYMYPRFIQLLIRNQLGDLSTHTIKYTSPALTQKVFANIRRVRKGFSRVKTPLFEGMVVEKVTEEGEAEREHVEEDTAAQGDNTTAQEDAA
nr:hypothetical protein [Tanacetum cinerariifolium]